MAVAQLTTIRRQQNPELRCAVELIAAGRILEAIDLLTQQKRIVEIPDPAKRYECIAADYLDAHEAGQRCLVVSPANDERRVLNQAIRDTLVAHRYVASLSQQHQILIPRDMTPAQPPASVARARQPPVHRQRRIRHHHQARPAQHRSETR
jgi:hypothetical protein